MAESDNKKLIRRYVDEIENTGDVSKINDFIAEDYTEVYLGKRYEIGIKGAIDHVLGVRKVYPDLKIEIENQVSEGECVVTSYTVTGTFMEEWLGLKPTGKPITFTGVNVDRIREGKIAEHSGAANLMEPLLEAGVLKKIHERGH
jgi:predicted ester cyclase